MMSTQVEINSYQAEMEIAEKANALARRFPRSETHGVTNQIRRAAVSVLANITEGNGRESSGAYVQALRMSQGSLREFKTLALLAARVGLTTATEIEPLLRHSEEAGRMLRGLIRSIQRNLPRRLDDYSYSYSYSYSLLPIPYSPR